MNVYENTAILKSQVSDSEADKFLESIKELVSKNGGEVLAEEKPGRKKLAYEIKKHREGFCTYVKFKASTDFPQKLEKQLKLNDVVLRSMLVKAIIPKKTVSRK